MSWKCKDCNAVMVSICNTCCYCKQPISECLGSRIYPDSILWHIVKREVNCEVLLTKEEEEFTRLFNHETLLIKDMNRAELLQHRNELATVALEARVRISAIDAKRRSDEANNSMLQDDWTPSDDGSLVSDAINTVNARKERMTKADKYKEQLEKLGLPEDTINTMMSAFNKATDKTLRSIVVTTAKVDPKQKPSVQPSKSEPFDPKSLGLE